MSLAQRLNQRVTIQKKSVSRAPNGEEIVAWITHLVLWAAVEPIRGREFFAAAQMQGAADYRVTLRWNSTITRDMRVMHGTKALIITAEPINVRSENRTLELMCVSGVRDG